MCILKSYMSLSYAKQKVKSQQHFVKNAALPVEAAPRLVADGTLLGMLEDASNHASEDVADCCLDPKRLLGE